MVLRTITGKKSTALVKVEVKVELGRLRMIEKYDLAYDPEQRILKFGNESLVLSTPGNKATFVRLYARETTKKDQLLRFCDSYFKLNDVIKEASYPLPKIDDTFITLSGSTCFSTLDFKSGY